MKEKITSVRKPKFAIRTDYAGEPEGAQYPLKTRIRLGVYSVPHPNPEDGDFEIRITKKNLSDWRPAATFLHD